MSNSLLMGLIEPAVRVDDRMIVADLPALLSGDSPAFMRFDGSWQAIVPSMLVAQPQSRRLLDVPRITVEPLGKEATLKDFERIAQRATIEHSPVVDGNELVGCLGHERVYANFGPTLAGASSPQASALGMLHDMANALMIVQPTVAASGAGDAAARAAFDHCVDLLDHLRAAHRGALYGSCSTDLSKLVSRFMPVLQAVARPDAQLVIAPVPGARVACSPLVIQRALINLVMNAAEAMGGACGLISIDFSVRGRVIDIVVADDGPGIPLSTLAVIFDRGFSTKADEGRGHGLANVRESARAAGGHVSVEPKLGGGTVFTLSLPTAQD